MHIDRDELWRIINQPVDDHICFGEISWSITPFSEPEVVVCNIKQHTSRGRLSQSLRCGPSHARQSGKCFPVGMAVCRNARRSVGNLKSNNCSADVSSRSDNGSVNSTPWVLRVAISSDQAAMIFTHNAVLTGPQRTTFLCNYRAARGFGAHIAM